MVTSTDGGEEWAARLKDSLAATPPPSPAPPPPPEGGLLASLAPRQAPPEWRPSLLDSLNASAASGLLAALASPPSPTAPERPPLPPSPLLESIRPPEPAAAPPPPPPLLRPALAAPPRPAAPPPSSPPPARPAASTPAEMFDLLVGRAPTRAELAVLAAAPDAAALRQVIAALPAFRAGVLGRALAAELRQATTRPSEAEMAVLDALGADAAAEPGMVVDWFGLRTPLALAPELSAHAGQVLPRPLPHDPRAPGAAWIGLAQSIVTATGEWRALALGAGRGDLLLAGAVAARRRGLTPRLHAIESDPTAFAALLRLAEANGIDPAAQDFRIAGPATTASDVLAAAPAWDFVWADPAPLALGLPREAGLRVLALRTHGRAEETAAIGALAGAGWKLLSETPATLRRQDPRGVLRAGALAWTR